MHSLHAKIISLSILAVVLVVALGGFVATSVEGQIERTEDARAALSAASEAVKLSLKVKDVRFDIVQVQQWLTDISATRGLDGLDDGPAEADRFAKAFETDSTEVLSLVERLGATDAQTAIEGVRAAFPDYYAVGKRMADAYVANGPEAGNVIMSDFDTASERLQGELEKLVSAADGHFSESQARLDKGLDTTVIDARHVRNFVVAAMIGIAVFISGFCLYFFVWVLKPLTCIARVTKQFANGEFENTVPCTVRGDEIGVIAKAVSAFGESAAERSATAEHQVEEERRIKEERKRMLEAVARSVRDQFESGLSQLDTAARDLDISASELANLAENADREAHGVAQSSEEASGNVSTVAAATDQLTASVTEIRRLVANTTETLETAEKDAAATTERVPHLVESVGRIGDMITAIRDIAEQTNLLALNATIEAARAGEMGKGFAVVAAEVKELSTQTAKATEEITVVIEEIQTSTDMVVQAVEQITSSVSEVGETAQGVSRAVDEQGCATNEITRNIAGAAEGTKAVARNVSNIARVVSETASSVSTVRRSSEAISEETAKLRETMVRFLAEIEAA